MVENESSLQMQENQLIQRLLEKNQEHRTSQVDGATGIWPGLGVLVPDIIYTGASKLQEVTSGQPMTIGGFMAVLGGIALAGGLTLFGIGLTEWNGARKAIKENNKIIDSINAARERRAASKA